ncbi:MAG: hypothetical protein WCK34_11170, partial [Bacteroidota bacterium]
MKTRILKFTVLLTLVLFSISSQAGKKVIRFSVSEPDAKIFVDGKPIGSGQAQIVVQSHTCIAVKVEKTGFITGKIEFCNKPEFTDLPKTFFMQLEKDDALEATEPADNVNTDIDVKTSKKEIDAWKLMSQIITTYFDVIEVT